LNLDQLQPEAHCRAKSERLESSQDVREIKIEQCERGSGLALRSTRDSGCVLVCAGNLVGSANPKPTSMNRSPGRSARLIMPEDEDCGSCAARRRRPAKPSTPLPTATPPPPPERVGGSPLPAPCPTDRWARDTARCHKQNRYSRNDWTLPQTGHQQGALRVYQALLEQRSHNGN